MTNGMQHADVFAALMELSRRYPHWRIGQLVSNVAGWADNGLWDVEDGQLLAAAQAHLDQSLDPSASATSQGERLSNAA